MPAPGDTAAGNLRGPRAVTTVQDPVGNVIRQIVFEALRRGFQPTIQKDDVGSLVK